MTSMRAWEHQPTYRGSPLFRTSQFFVCCGCIPITPDVDTLSNDSVETLYAIDVTANGVYVTESDCHDSMANTSLMFFLDLRLVNPAPCNEWIPDTTIRTG